MVLWKIHSLIKFRQTLGISDFFALVSKSFYELASYIYSKCINKLWFKQSCCQSLIHFSTLLGIQSPKFLKESVNQNWNFENVLHNYVLLLALISLLLILGIRRSKTGKRGKRWKHSRGRSKTRGKWVGWVVNDFEFFPNVSTYQTIDRFVVTNVWFYQQSW